MICDSAVCCSFLCSFQAILGIDLELDDRSDRESDIMGYTSLRPVSPSNSSTNSLQVTPQSRRVFMFFVCQIRSGMG